MEKILREWLFKLGLTGVMATVCYLVILIMPSSLESIDFWWLPAWILVMAALTLKTLTESKHWKSTDLKEHAFERFIWFVFYGSLFILASFFVVTAVFIGEETYFRFITYPLQATGISCLIRLWFDGRKQANQYYLELLKEFLTA